jgi:glyoxylase-like metal-dependent hydrolase (beta-lactamase superfamily II)
VKAVAVHPDAIVVTSRIWQTNATALRAGGETLLIDSPYFPDELEALPALLRQAGFEPNALFATHADYDHVLARFAFPELTLGVGDPTMERIRAEPGAVQRELRDEDARNYVARPAPLALGNLQSLPVPGYVELGQHELELHPADGHTPDGTAYVVPWLGVLVCGDYLSPVEIPWISPGQSAEAYLATLDRLRELVLRCETVVPGHGRPLARDEAEAVLEEDVRYLRALIEQGAAAALPPGRRTGAQRRIHEQNVATRATS